MYKRLNEDLTDKQIELLFAGFIELIDNNYPRECVISLGGVVMEKRGRDYLVGRVGETLSYVPDCRAMFESGAALFDGEVDVFFVSMWYSIYENMSAQNPVQAKVAFDRCRRVCDGMSDKSLN